MLLTDQYYAPADLTGYARAALHQRAENQFILDRWFPNRDVDDLVYRFTQSEAGLTEAASFRAYDAESPIAAREGVKRVTGELPPISRKIRLSEYEQLRNRNRDVDTQIANYLERDAERLVRQTNARMEVARGDAVALGTIAIAENRLRATVTFGRKAAHTVVAAVAWTDTETAPALDQLITWAEVYNDTNGQMPGAMLTSRQARSLLLRNKQIREQVLPIGSTATLITLDALNAVLASFDLPPIRTYDAQVKVAGVARRIIPSNRLVMLPAPGDPGDPESSELGGTLWGTTLEASDPRYAIEDGEAPGIVVGTYKSEDPQALWTRSSAIGIPIMANPDLTLCAQVLA